MFKHILVAVDGSRTSTGGLEVAIGLAKEHRATLHVMHVIGGMTNARASDRLGMGYIPSEFVDKWREGLRDNGRRVLADAEKMAQKSGQPINQVLVETPGHEAATAILAQARKLRAELIVLGTHGRRGLTRLLMGSDAETVLRETRVPVLLVRSQERAQTPRASGKATGAGRTVDHVKKQV